MTKYLCMSEDCDFVTIDSEEAKGHMEMGESHIMAEVSNDDEGVYCKTFK